MGKTVIGIAFSEFHHLLISFACLSTLLWDYHGGGKVICECVRASLRSVQMFGNPTSLTLPLIISADFADHLPWSLESMESV